MLQPFLTNTRKLKYAEQLQYQLICYNVTNFINIKSYTLYEGAQNLIDIDTRAGNQASHIKIIWDNSGLRLESAITQMNVFYLNDIPCYFKKNITGIIPISFITTLSSFQNNCNIGYSSHFKYFRFSFYDNTSKLHDFLILSACKKDIIITKVEKKTKESFRVSGSSLIALISDMSLKDILTITFKEGHNTFFKIKSTIEQNNLNTEIVYEIENKAQVIDHLSFQLDVSMFKEFLLFSQTDLNDTIKISLDYGEGNYYLVLNDKYFTKDIGFKPTDPVFYKIDTEALSPIILNFDSKFNKFITKDRIKTIDQAVINIKPNKIGASDGKRSLLVKDTTSSFLADTETDFFMDINSTVALNIIGGDSYDCYINKNTYYVVGQHGYIATTYKKNKYHICDNIESFNRLCEKDIVAELNLDISPATIVKLKQVKSKVQNYSNIIVTVSTGKKKINVTFNTDTLFSIPYNNSRISSKIIGSYQLLDFVDALLRLSEGNNLKFIILDNMTHSPIYLKILDVESNIKVQYLQMPCRKKKSGNAV